MFGFGKQKKDAYQEPQQEDYFYDEYDEGYEEDYGYDPYPEEDYERPDYERGERRTRQRTGESSEERPINEEPAAQTSKQEVARLEETIAQLKHQLEVKQTELTTMAATLTEKDQALQDQQAVNETQIKQLNEQQDQSASLKEEIQQMKQKLANQQSDEAALTEARKQIEKLKQEQAANEEMKDELASILVESKKQEREILERAEYEANGIRHQAEHESPAANAWCSVGAAGNEAGNQELPQTATDSFRKKRLSSSSNY